MGAQASNRLGDLRRSEKCRQDRRVTDQERVLVELLASEPPGHFAVVFAGVAGGAGRHDVVECVPATARDRRDAVALQRRTRRATVGAPSPGVEKFRPLGGGEVVVHSGEPSSPSFRVARPRCLRQLSGGELAARVHNGDDTSAAAALPCFASARRNSHRCRVSPEDEHGRRHGPHRPGRTVLDLRPTRSLRISP